MKSLYYFLLTGILFLTNCTDAARPNVPAPAHETFTIKSKYVSETRTINVWTPEDYSKNSDSLPVMYMADGGVMQEFPHMANTFSELIKSKKIPPIILVGIEKTQDTRNFTGFTEVEKDKEFGYIVGESEKFRTFIKDELFPEINTRYRTTNEKGIIGESLSGLFVVETLMLYPEMFDSYIAFDPSLWWNDKYLVKTAKEHLTAISQGQQKRFWFAGSGTKSIAPIMEDLSKTLQTQNLPNLKWKYSYEPNEKHNTIYRGTQGKALIWALGKNTVK